jgi:uncharacterized lipoprotein NlpE involved in copper resistance
MKNRWFFAIVKTHGYCPERYRINHLSAFLLGANMQTFRQKFKQSLTLFFFIVSFSGYNIAFAETTESDTHHAENRLWSGVYQGFVPCDDCKGIKTSLALNKNNSYILISQYVGKSPREIVEKGKFTLDDESNTVVLTPRNSSETRHYFIGDNTLIQLDSKGNRITGELAERYVLRKAEMTENQPSSSHH